MKERFEGAGKSRLIEELQRQELTGGDPTVAQAIADAGELVEYSLGDRVITEGASDNDVYFLLAGRVAIVIKGQQRAHRDAGKTVGEMAAIAPSQPRSASVVAEGTVVALKLTNDQFFEVAERHPKLWKPLAGELSRRLYQRNDDFKQPNDRPKVFIISSSEAAKHAGAVGNGLQAETLPTIWNQGVFFASAYALEALEEAVDRSDFAVAVTNFEDIIQTRGVTLPTVRDNVIFELGLFMGRLGRRRTVLVHPSKRDIKLPSDFNGLTTIRYNPDRPKDIDKQVAPACEQILEIVHKFGVRTERL